MWCKKSLARMVLYLLKTLLRDGSFCLHSRMSLPTLMAKKPQTGVKISEVVQMHKATLLWPLLYNCLKKGQVIRVTKVGIQVPVSLRRIKQLWYVNR